ncbi:MAG: methionine synthase [Bacteroides sp.]|nr:methionine synthase [Bacteroides sp.]
MNLPSDRILILDGAQGTMIQQRQLTEQDFRGNRFADWPSELKGNNDLLNLTRPDIIADIARQYVEAGADIISTNTFNSNAISMADYGMESLAPEMAREGARIARRVADEAGRPVLVAGSIGPTNKTASMSPDIDDPGYRAVTYQDLYEAYRHQIQALLQGGADMILFETVFDTLNLKAGLAAAADLATELTREIPVMISVTIAGKDGRTFSGQTLEAFISSIEHSRPLSIGLNCSFGPREIMPWLKKLSELSPWPVSCHPNAGLPDASGSYGETPDSMARVIETMCREGMVNIVGGCCGTTPAHIADIARVARGKAPRPLPTPKPVESLRLSGLELLEVAKGERFINIGERCNVAGSRKFLRLINEKNYDEALAIARRQIADGADIIDINMDDGLLETATEMVTFLNLLAAEPDIAGVPVMIDSSDWEVITRALECIQGKPVVNSISLKEGEETFLRRAEALRRAGAAVVVMAFDEEGQAVTYERKIEVCERAYRLLTERLSFPASDIIFDPNILTVATGIPEHDRYALDFIRATAWIRANLPGAHVSGGLSNLSFAFRGNNPLREAMHSVFLHHARLAGMDMAILNPATRVDYDSIDPELRDLLEDVLLCRSDGASERLAAWAQEHQAVKGAPSSSPRPTVNREKTPVEERLTEALVHGDSSWLEADIAEALASGSDPVTLIDGPLMRGMERVGTLFGEGRMFLPQVVKTARTMKAAVTILQPEIERRGAASGAAKAGKIVFATVKGDVHDIGKNIVSIILACNNYEVIDLGVMVPAETILAAVKEHRPDIVCLSGLITPSLGEMVNVARTLRDNGIDTPLMVGGATTSMLHTALKIDPVYDGPVMHVADASQNPIMAATLLNPVTREDFITRLKSSAREARDNYEHRRALEQLVPVAEARSKHYVTSSPAPAPAAYGCRVSTLRVADVAPLINWKAYLTAWSLPATLSEAFSLPGDSESRRAWTEAQTSVDKAAQVLALADTTRQVLARIIDLDSPDMIRAVTSLNHCTLTPDDTLVIEAAAGNKSGATLPFLRRQSPDDLGSYTSVMDYLHAPGDTVGAFAVSVNIPADIAGDDDYHRLIVTLLSHRLAEAASQYLHSQVAPALWPGVERGIRPAIGYPSLPDQTLMHQLDNLLNMEKIGITVTSNGALEPSASVAGLYIANPEARYTLLGPVGDDQLALYADRRNLPLPTLRSILNR